MVIIKIKCINITFYIFKKLNYITVEFFKTFTRILNPLFLCEGRTADPPVAGVGMDRVRTKHAVPLRRGPVTTTRHEARQTYAAKPSTRRNGGSARPDSDTTVQYAQGARYQAAAGDGPDIRRD